MFPTYDTQPDAVDDLRSAADEHDAIVWPETLTSEQADALTAYADAARLARDAADALADAFAL